MSDQPLSPNPEPQPTPEDEPPQASQPAAPGEPELDEAALEAPIDLSTNAFQAAINLQWDQMEKYRGQAQAKADALVGAEADLVRGLTAAVLTMTEGIALQFRDASPDRFDRALKLFDQAGQDLEALRQDYPEETASNDFKAMVTGMELSALMVTRRLARDRGDRPQVLVVDAQLKSVLQGMPEEYRTEQQTFLAITRHLEISDQLTEIIGALNAMDLPRALRGISEVREEGRAALEVMTQGMGPGIVFEQSQLMISGTYDYVEALESYIRALHDSVVGDVTKAHIDQLTQAEELLLAGTKKMKDGLLILGQVTAEQSEAQIAPYQALLVPMRNLRTLCEKSLKPKSWLASGGFKFVFVFLVTAVVLGVVAAVNAGTGVSDRLLAGYVLLVAFVVGLIGGFGFEALRFLPFADLLSRSRPGVQAAE